MRDDLNFNLPTLTKFVAEMAVEQEREAQIAVTYERLDMQVEFRAFIDDIDLLSSISVHNLTN